MAEEQALNSTSSVASLTGAAMRGVTEHGAPAWV